MQRHEKPVIIGPRGGSTAAAKSWVVLLLIGSLLVATGLSVFASNSVKAAGVYASRRAPTEGGDSSINHAFLPTIQSAIRSPRPIIVRFSATPPFVDTGGNVTLSWQILNSVDKLTLEPGIGDVTGRNSIVVSPNKTTSYLLTARNQAGSTSARTVVTVAPPPEITSFAVDPETINHGERTKLSWTVSGMAESLVIGPGIGDVTGQTQVMVSPTETTTYTLTASNPSGSNSAQAVVRVSPETELLVFDWNKPVEKSDSGFPGEDPTGAANDNWTHPPNFAEGTYHYRVEIRSQPVPKEMQVQYCVWQKIPGEEEQRESCADRMYLKGDPGAKATGFEAIEDMWKKSEPINYAVDRSRHGAVIRNKQGKPVSAKQDWDWNGEIPEEWYPLDWRFTVVVVAKGETFSGWSNYLEP